MWNPAIPDGRTWTKFGEHGLSLENMDEVWRTWRVKRTWKKRNTSTK